MTAYYNEIDPLAVATLRELIKAGHIAPGIVDDRSIQDVLPNDLKGFTQCHFFAGFGVWSLALRRAGIPDTARVWTGSCPCQPFSTAGQGNGFADERHLWPAFHYLISIRRPTVVYGEQVASKDAGPWVDLVQTDLEALGYAFGAVPFPSAGVGAPHIRDRLYWVADTDNARLEGRLGMLERSDCRPVGQGGMAGGLDYSRHHDDAGQSAPASAGQSQADRPANQLGGPSVSLSWVGDSDSVNAGRDCGNGAGSKTRSGRGGALDGDQRNGVDGASGVGGMADSTSGGRREECADAGGLVVGGGAQGFAPRLGDGGGGALRPGPTNGLWRDADWLACRDGKWRPVEPGTFPLAHGAPARVGRLRGYGNAINAEAARIFIESVT